LLYYNDVIIIKMQKIASSLNSLLMKTIVITRVEFMNDYI